MNLFKCFTEYFTPPPKFPKPQTTLPNVNMISFTYFKFILLKRERAHTHTHTIVVVVERAAVMDFLLRGWSGLMCKSFSWQVDDVKSFSSATWPVTSTSQARKVERGQWRKYPDLATEKLWGPPILQSRLWELDVKNNQPANWQQQQQSPPKWKRFRLQ